MITTGAKFWYALTALGLLAAAVYYAATGGEKFGAVVLVFAAVAAAVLGTMSVVVRDGDVELPAEGETVLEAPRPQSLPAIWPAAIALGVAVTVIGLASGNILLWVGIGILVAAGAEWMVQAWAERSTPDPKANLGLRNRVMFPIEIPALAVLGVAFIVLAFSRVLLALPQRGSVIVALVVAAVILGVAAMLANRPRMSSSVVSGAVAIGVVALIGGGIAGGVAGEREFEHHGEEGHAEEGHAEGEAAGEEIVITADDIAFQPAEVRIPADEPVTLVLENEDEGVRHSLHVQGVGDNAAATTEIIEGPATAEIELTAPAGEYPFICDVHPTEMNGVIVAEGLAGEGEGVDPDIPEVEEPESVREPVETDEPEAGSGA